MNTWSAVMLSAGIAIGGWFIGHGFSQGRETDRFVTVKGVAERMVSADTALWPLTFVATNDDLAVAQETINQNKQKVLVFLKRHAIESNSVAVNALEVNDLLANPYRNGPTSSRYIISMTLMISSKDPEVIKDASQRLEELVEVGVVLSSDHNPQGGPTYLFTGLNTIKPEMIAKATSSARQAAEQFAKDSGSHIGAIRKANQGVFEILPLEQISGTSQESQIKKTVRVVATIEYYIED